MNDLTQIEETSQEVLTEFSQQPTKKKRKKMTKKRKLKKRDFLKRKKERSMIFINQISLPIQILSPYLQC